MKAFDKAEWLGSENVLFTVIIENTICNVILGNKPNI